ncbi:HAD family hydrolase [archaeon]|jgi:D-glycero-D-manno-heptose 1,7-bisphosphate phosphatase|nr:HAD family hydrolase [archaeon]MBT4242148.1 HAD family hydrolase [archaeon]MBT4417836.1 HAD family hydrolase [archaeon]
MGKKGIILDRDGVINYDNHGVGKISDFEFIPGVFESLTRLQDAGYLLTIVTNQGGRIDKGYFSSEDYQKVNEWMLERFSEKGIKIEKVYSCLHASSENCDCRKPKPGMLNQAIKELDLDELNSWLIGDKISDLQMGKASDCGKILLESEYVQDLDCFKLKDLTEAADYILSGNSKPIYELF